jgi:hypothetical protein
MSEPTTVAVEWVCSEGLASEFGARLRADGGEVTGTEPFVPNAEEPDLHADAQLDPLVIVSTVFAFGLLMRYIRELVSDLKGREIALIDLSGEKPQLRRIRLDRKTTRVIVKAADRSVTSFATSDIDKLERHLAGLLH